jgi:hypothetical protein
MRCRAHPLRATSEQASSLALAILPPPAHTAAALALVQAASALDRGALATPRDAARIDALARELERRAPAAQQPASSLAGRWRLLYISAPEIFRQSPFFDAFSAAVGNRAAAEAIFAFTDALPMARVGRAWQTIRLDSSAGAGRLVSEVELAVGELPFFAGLAGVVESSATIDAVAAPAPDTSSSSSSASASSYVLSMTMAQTRVTRSLFSALGGDAIVAPVERAFEAVRGPGGARVAYRVTAMTPASGGGGGGGGAAALRVTRAEGTGLLMVHAREDGEN